MNDVHDRAREIAQAVSEGINCMANLRKLAKTNASPPPECDAQLDDMEHALQSVRDGVRDGAVETSLVVDDALLADIHRLRALVSDWLVTGRASPNLVLQIEEVLKRLSVDPNVLDSLS